MYKTRKSTGSASFLNRLQRNAQFSSAGAESGAEDAADEAIATATPEALLELLAEVHETTVAALAERFGITPEQLADPLGQLVRNDCAKTSHAIADPASVVLITPIGMKTASFAKIARA